MGARGGQAGIPKGPYKKRVTSEAMKLAARNRAARSVPAMLEGKRRAEERRALEAAARIRRPLPTCNAIATYRLERAKAEDRGVRVWRESSGSHPTVRGHSW